MLSVRFLRIPGLQAPAQPFRLSEVAKLFGYTSRHGLPSHQISTSKQTQSIEVTDRIPTVFQKSGVIAVTLCRKGSKRCSEKGIGMVTHAPTFESNFVQNRRRFAQRLCLVACEMRQVKCCDTENP